ncbi:hypothetical protein ACYUJ6_11760 [Clostridium sp. JNZ X4-2]
METEINFNSLITSVGNCCLGKEICGDHCDKSNCLIGYCKKNLLDCLKSGQQFLDEEIDEIPLFDTKVFDKSSVIDTIGLILNQCKSCNAYHDEDCIINILRSACEVILFGNPKDYKGSVLLYLADIKNDNSETADKIHEAYILNKKSSQN